MLSYKSEKQKTATLMQLSADAVVGASLSRDVLILRAFLNPKQQKTRRISATGLTYMDVLMSIRIMDECC
ncbi:MULTISPECIES: hypothetical protein [Pseudoalteromonas]|uniref:Uncharacterized protein n=1 Tax=Pseudoalteromonas galatheae TaxID=579562 RepID=A0A8T6YKG7_9GAMM|nr:MULTISPECIES: hypothetical protein [Pseudoalteromonas]NKC17953.1 hypothetical protein [Pseudoalteromonas galatheae]